MSIYLNNAATTWPKPKEVADSVYDFMVNQGANVARGAATERDLASLDNVFSCRLAIAELMGGYDKANPKYVTFTPNITESINTILKGIIKPEMRIVTTSMEHNAVVRPLRRLEDTGVKAEYIQCSMKGYLSPTSLDIALQEKTDLVIMSHCSNVCGSLNDIEKIAEVCAKHKVPLVIDSAQTAGIIPINIADLGLSALCFTGHKGLFGPQGVGGIVWSPKFAELCEPLIDGGTGSFSHEEHQPTQLPDKFESGTPPLPAIAGLLASVNWIKKTGMTEIREKEEKLGQRLEDGLRKIKGLRIAGPAEEDKKLPVYAINIKNKDNAIMAAELSNTYEIESRPGLHCAPLAHKTLGTFPEGALRLSPSYFNTEEEIDKTIEALDKLAKE
ncbi:MAG: aminotransferase class V-fold PLP-dependent enzyme [Synergistaceae bacterium]